jgi:hypothetical protein
LKYLTVFQSSFQQQQQEFVFEGHLNESFSLQSKKSSNLIERKERRECISCLSVHTCVNFQSSFSFFLRKLSCNSKADFTSDDIFKLRQNAWNCCFWFYIFSL